MSIFKHFLSADTAEIGIKNTFVHIAAEHAASKRRSSSAPPHFHIPESDNSFDNEKGQPNGFSMDDCDASTIENSDASDADSLSDNPSPTASVGLANFDKDAFSEQSPASTRTPLRRDSKMWSPCGASTALAATSAPLDASPLDIRHRLSRTLLHAKGLIGTLSLIYRTALMESNLEDCNYAQILLSKTTQAVVSAAGISIDVFVIGHVEAQKQLDQGSITKFEAAMSQADKQELLSKISDIEEAFAATLDGFDQKKCEEIGLLCGTRAFVQRCADVRRMRQEYVENCEKESRDVHYLVQLELTPFPLTSKRDWVKRKQQWRFKVGLPVQLPTRKKKPVR